MSGQDNGQRLLAETSLRQRQAADPTVFAWVSANAGAGKTKVLADRVMRLLLAGAPPGRILCVTFTRAAAANMTERVFAELGRWVTLPGEALADALFRLEGARPDPARLARARRLFARAVETPGGLKIDTIHAFCERLLHLAPFEAGVPARFSVLDESQTGELMAAARDRVLTEAASGAPGTEALGAALAVASAADSADRMIGAIDRAVGDERVPDDPDRLAALIARLGSALGLRAGEDEDAVVREIVEGGLSRAEVAVVAEAMECGKTDDRKQAVLLRLFLAADNHAQARQHYHGFFFTKDGPRKRLATGDIDGAICEALMDEQNRLLPLLDRLRAARLMARTQALHALAGAVRRRFTDAKGRMAALDFDDLIDRTLDVLGPGSGAWVLYKLDRGIDHVLIDEAQDTNPKQWRILRRVTEDFTAGAGAGGDRVRTLFAVGDPKQSIYGFQGADPRWFESSRRHWSGLTEAAGLGFTRVSLDLSFRSAPAVLAAVDDTFRVEAHNKGLSYEDAVRSTSHKSARPDAPGHVELWPIARKADKPADPDAWSLPVDEEKPSSPAVETADRVARAVRLWTTRGDEAGRVFRPSDILVLSRKRGPAFFAVIRALRVAGVPVAGADRFDIGEHIAVMDLVAAGQAALLPDNDLVVASTLKSPLVGLDDDDLIRLAVDRGKSEPLHAAIARHAAAGDPAGARAHEALGRWSALARGRGPFGFYATLLGPLGGRRRLIARLGHEAADAIDAFLCYAESAERGPDAPSLTTFLARFESAAHTIKRDLDSSGDEVRVMTVHGAKGLEAPVVIVVDGCDMGGAGSPLVAVPIGDDEALPVWSSAKTQDCAATALARARDEEARMEEHNRLLYVAMTRARDRLVIAPFSTASGDPPEHSWCRMIRRGFADAERAPEEIETAHGGPAEIWRDAAIASAATPAGAALPAPVALPGWLMSEAAAEPEPAPPLRPSGALAAADREEAGPTAPLDPAARLFGTLTHALIERLPGIAPERRAAVAEAFVQSRAGGLAAETRGRIVADALGVLADPALADLFGPGSRAEVAICGEVAVPSGRRVPVSGQIDRLVVGETAVLIADFKTGRPPGEGEPPPAAYVAQLALYRALLADLYPGRAIRACLVYTAGPRVIEPGPGQMEASLAALSAP